MKGEAAGRHELVVQELLAGAVGGEADQRAGDGPARRAGLQQAVLVEFQDVQGAGLVEGQVGSICGVQLQRELSVLESMLENCWTSTEGRSRLTR